MLVLYVCVCGSVGLCVGVCVCVCVCTCDVRVVYVCAYMQ